MIFESFPVGPLQCNCVVLGDERSRDAVVIDPGDEAAAIEEVLDQHRLDLKHIVHTHAHIDHILAADHLRRTRGAGVGLHEADEFLWRGVQMQASFLGMKVSAAGPVDRHLREGDVIPFGDHRLTVLETPGHTPGSVCFLLDEPSSHVLFSGDTLFQRGIGRTDLWGGSYPAILRSIHDRIFTLEEDTLVHPGHGAGTTVREEKKSNPFLGDIARAANESR
jgi:hydroxyacylglutathione hydrolase